MDWSKTKNILIVGLLITNIILGLYLYNKRHRLLYPDLGRKQRYKISRELLKMEMQEEESLREAIHRCRSYLVGRTPLSIIITNLSQENPELLEGVKELAKYGKITRRQIPTIVVNVFSYPFAAKTTEEKISADLLQTKAYKIKNKLRRAGAMVVDWNPLEQQLVKVMLSQVGRR